MAQVLAVFGATGQQGNSVINYVLNDAHLSRKYKIRAITRDANSEKSQRLATQGVEVVQGDVYDRESLGKALTGVHTVFLMTVPEFGLHAVRSEFDAAKNVADVSLPKGVQHIVFSTLPSISDISGGKYTKGTSFDEKARAESYIRSLPVKSAFFSPGSFMENYITVACPRRSADADGSNTYTMAMHISPQTRIPLVDAAGDTGKFIGVILANPDKYSGKVMYGAGRTYTLEEIALAMGRATGEEVIYKQISAAEYEASIKFGGDILVQTMSYFEEFGYYGTDTEELVASAAESRVEGLTTFDEFLQRRRPRLQ